MRTEPTTSKVKGDYWKRWLIETPYRLRILNDVLAEML